MYVLSNLVFCVILAFFAGVFAVALKRWPNLWQSLPRERVAGELIAVVCLVWSAWHAILMLEGGLARFHIGIKILVPVTALLVYFYLNFLFARALGGLLLLGLVHLLHWAFVANPPLRPLYSLVCYLYAFVGMILVATPWYFRDVLKKATDDSRWRVMMAGIAGASAVFYLVYAIIG